MKTIAYHRPRTLKEAWRLKSEAGPGARFIAGGTDLMVGDHAPQTLISLRSIPGLAGIEPGDPTRIGALTLVADLLDHPGLANNYPALHEACRLFASLQIRNAATVGGNLANASPAADLAPPLLVHDATVRLCGAGGARDLGLAEFLTGPGETCLNGDEVLTDIFLPTPAPGARTKFLRKTRVRMDIALASVAVLVEMEGQTCRKVRIAAGAVAPTPRRLADVEALVAGATITPALIEQAAKLAAASVQPIDDIRTSAKYRRRLVGVYVKRALSELCS